jgi:hypothetical protein
MGVNWGNPHNERKTMTLESKRVAQVFINCLFNEGEDTSNHVPADGIMSKVGFHPGRLEQHKAEIQAMLAELPDEFMASKGGGMSFLNACMDRHGNQWTGYHGTMEQLFQLGLATKAVVCLMPRELWEALPGGMPYYQVKDEFEALPTITPAASGAA